MQIRFPDFSRGLLAVLLGSIGIACLAFRGTGHHSLSAYSLLFVGSLAIAVSAILSLVIADKHLSKRPE